MKLAHTPFCWMRCEGAGVDNHYPLHAGDHHGDLDGIEVDLLHVGFAETGTAGLFGLTADFVALPCGTVECSAILARIYTHIHMYVYI